MKKFATGCAAAAALLSMVDIASAADMAAKAKPAATYNPCGVARFSGAYVGGNAGAIAYTALHTDQDRFLTTGDYSSNTIGATAGIQAGYDWQSCNKVFGIVADWNWADTATTAQSFPNSPGVRDFSNKMDWFSTIRARAGVAVNDALFYVTGGVVAAEIKSTVTGDGFESSQQFSSGGTRWGFVGGVGAEFALRDNWSLNTELLYMQFQKDNATFFSPGQERLVSFEHHDSAWVGRAGLNYRWDNPRAAYAAANMQGAAPGPCGPSRFNGGYVGGNAGAVSTTASRQDRDGFISDSGDFSATGAGFTAGAQVGWDWQSCNLLLGVVADWNWTNADTVTRRSPNAVGVVDLSTKAKMEWFSTIRVRAGLVVDDVMVYVTGGVAAADIETTITNRQVGFTDEQHRFSDTRWGFAGGVGAEFVLSGGWSLNTELLYMQFAKSIDTFTFRGPGFTQDFSFENHNSAWVSRAGLNYRWDHAAAGVSAKSASPCGPARFSGGYIGGNAGAIRRTSVTDDQDNLLADNSQHTGTASGATAGVQAGYDWQSCHKVFGIVADLNVANADTVARFLPNVTNIADATMRSEMDWFGTIRARSGLAVNDALVYLTGGVALAKIESQVSFIVPVAGINDQLTSSSMRWGWTGGAGVEYALANGWSVNGEVLYMQFRKDSDTFRTSGNTPRSVSFEHQDSAWVGRVGVNYRWGAGVM